MENLQDNNQPDHAVQPEKLEQVEERPIQVQPAAEVQQEQQVEAVKLEQPAKRPRGRPKVIKPPKVPKKNGRPKIYENGSRDYHRQSVKVEKNRYKELIAHEQKYLELLKVMNI